MRRRRLVPPRRSIFIGVEGKSEPAFVRFLQRCCEKAGIRVHEIVAVGTGGDTVPVVRAAHRSLTRHSGSGEVTDRLVLLDSDRVAADVRAGRDAKAVASKRGREIVFQEPNLEGLLVRLHDGFERRKIRKGAVRAELQRLWPDYRKPPTLRQLSRRFKVDDIRRAARHDGQLQRLLAILGL